MMSSRARKMVNDVTKRASSISMKEWKAAILRMYALFGESAIYYVNCDRFIREGDDDAYAFPYDEWEGGKKIHHGLQVQHSYYEPEMKQFFSYGDEVILLA